MSNKKELKNKENYTDFSKRPRLSMEVNGTKHDFLAEEQAQGIEDKINEARAFMKDNTKKGLSEDEKVELYGEVKGMWDEVANRLNGAQFGLILKRPEYNYMTSLLMDKMEYDVNLLFYAIELVGMLKRMRDTKNDFKYKNDVDPLTYHLNATDITYLYHVLQEHKVKGLTEKSLIFAEIIRRIGDISKIFGYYDSLSKDLSTEIQDWTVTLDEDVNVEEKPKGPKAAKGKKLEASNSEK